MHISLIKRAAALCASALAVATPAAFSAEWTSFKVGQLTNNFTYSHRLDGQFVLGLNKQVFVQDTFGSPGKTLVPNTGNADFDPSFIAIRSASSGLIGGGFSGTSGLFPFNPSAPATPIVSTALASLQNYAAVFWKHPTSGREGWLIVGGNGTLPPMAFFANSNITFVSTDGSKVGAITGDLSSYSGGIATDAQGNLYAALADASPAESEKVIKFTADQIDAAVLSLDNTPAPLAKAAATLVFKMDASGSLAVDSAGRLWAGGYQIPHLQAYDPVSGVQRRFVPDHAKLKGASGPNNYTVQAYTRNAEGFVSFLANDGFYTGGSDLVLGYKAVSQLNVRSVQFTTLPQTVEESAAGTIDIAVSVTPAPTAKITVPVTYAGTATKGKDYTATTTSLVFNAGESSKNIQIKVINDVIDEDIDNEMVVITLGNPSPVAQAGLGAQGSEQYTLTIHDEDQKPLITAVQNFGTPRIGSFFSYQIATTGGAAVTYSVKGLPPGLTFNPTTGVISGRPTSADEFDQVWITATNAAGTSISRGYIITVEDYAALAHGSFTAVTDRLGTAVNGLGARVDISTTATGTFTGKVYIGTKSGPVSGPLDTSGANPTGQSVFKVGNVTATLNFAIDATNGEFSGTLSGGTSFTGGLRAVISTTLTGAHNFFLAVPGGAWAEVPEGTGFGTITVLANGSATVSGRAADGSSFSTSTFLGSNGGVILYQGLYTVPGSLKGTLNIANDPARTVTGALNWSKPDHNPGNLYADGWDPVLSLNASGGKYRPAVGATIAMDLPAMAGNNANLHLADGGIPTDPTDINLRVTASANVGIAAPHKLTIVNSSGAITGSATVGTGANKKVLPIQGLLVPDASTPNLFDSKGHGFFLLPAMGSAVSRSGMVLIEAIPLP